MNKIVCCCLFFSFIKANVSDVLNASIGMDEFEQFLVVGVSEQGFADKVFCSVFYQLSVMKSFYGINGIVKVNANLLRNFKFFNKLFFEAGIKGDFNKDYQWSVVGVCDFENSNILSCIKGSVYAKFYGIIAYCDLIFKLNKFGDVLLTFGAARDFEVAEQKIRFDGWVTAQLYSKIPGSINFSCGVLF